MDSAEKAKTGMLLVGHGTRDPAGVRQFLETAARVAEALPQYACQSCFLEIAEPNVGAGVAQLLSAGVERFVVMPLLLFAAGHAKQDVPREVERALASSPGVEWVMARHLGLHAGLRQQSLVRLRQASCDGDAQDLRTCLLVVGRGSLDDEATAEMHAYGAAVAAQWSCANHRVAFFAMAHPKLREVLDQIAAEPWRRVVVLPHLLFDGLIMQMIEQLVNRYRSQFPRIDWRLARPLGPTDPVVTAICERIVVAARAWQKPCESPVLQDATPNRQL